MIFEVKKAVHLPQKKHENMHEQGIIIGLLSFLIIGIFHPLVIQAEYYFGKKFWWIFWAGGMLCIGFSIVTSSVFLSTLLALLGFSCLWAIKEMFEQEQRVKKGWFPANPKRKGAVVIRPERPADYLAIRRIHEQASGRLDEAFLVEKLRRHVAFAPEMSLVAVKNNIVAGHVLFFPVNILSPEGKATPAGALLPVSVCPAFQNQGIGSALVEASLLAAAKQSYRLAVAIGQEEFYSRFGFQKASGYAIDGIFDCQGGGVWMIRELQPGSLNGVNGRIEYPIKQIIF
jgi:predicted N-acetyltransferase YhbS